MAKILPIEKGAVHRICSGQVVVDLSVAVKELVENSLDADSKSIEVKLKEYGAALIEVVDNGSGIDASNYEALALKHHTSKLGSFEDLEGVMSFGFRGEALSSLCALARLTVVTCTASQDVGVELVYDSHGVLSSQKPAARDVGTTVTLTDLFHSLPVRHREFVKHAKREYTKLLQVLQAYALISVGVRLKCSNVTAGGKKHVSINTHGNKSVRENISNVFGPKQLQTLVEVDVTEGAISIQGFVSKAGSGQGRSSADRQYYYVNGRPCDIPKVSKAVTETYRSFNMHQHPFVVLNVCLSAGTYDVNVTPDKRKLYLHTEGQIIDLIKAHLSKLFEDTPFTYETAKLEDMAFLRQSSMTSFSSGPTSKASPLEPRPNGNKTAEESQLATSPAEPVVGPSESEMSVPVEAEEVPTEAAEATGTDVAAASPEAGPATSSRSTATPHPEAAVPSRAVTGEEEPPGSAPMAVEEAGGRASMAVEDEPPGSASMAVEEEPDGRASMAVEDEPPGSASTAVEDKPDDSASTVQPLTGIASFARGGKPVAPPSSAPLQPTPTLKPTLPNVPSKDLRMCAECERMLPRDAFSATQLKKKGDGRKCQECIAGTTMGEPTLEGNKFAAFGFGAKGSTPAVVPHSAACSHEHAEEAKDMPKHVPARPLERASTTVAASNYIEVNGHQYFLDTSTQNETFEVPYEEITLNLDMKTLKEGLQRKKRKREDDEEGEGAYRTWFGITKDAKAEEELKRVFNKDSFKQMEVIGQFNLGFIIARLGEDLFIIDQHATDEKNNFERLKRTTVLNTQTLLKPRKMELTAAEELVVTENMDIFNKNGFSFVHDEDAPPGQRLSLTSYPFSKHTEFGPNDIYELILLLRDQPGNTALRPTRVTAMLAMRACRSAIMIGTALNQSQMTKILSHMSEMEQPWNCPHGRPTMRHLIDLRLAKKRRVQVEEEEATEALTEWV